MNRKHEEGIGAESFISGELCGKGDLFGALIGKRINPSSLLYRLGNFELALPELNQDESFEIFKPLSTTTAAETLPSYELEHRADVEEEIKVFLAPSSSSSSDSGSSSRSSLSSVRPYFSLASKSQFSDALYAASWRTLACREEDFVDLSLLALQGIDSSLYGGRRGGQTRRCNFFIVGRSVDSVASFVKRFDMLHVCHTLLATALQAFEDSHDPTQRALGVAVGEVLHLHNTSITALRDAYSGKVFGSELALPSLTDLWRSTTLHRATLKQLIGLIACPELAMAVKTLDCQEEQEHGKADTAWQIVNRFLHPHEWQTEAQKRDWDLLEDLLNKLELLQRVATISKREQVFETSLLFHSNHDASVSFANMLVAACVLRSVSTPLLEQLQRTMFDVELDPDPEEAMVSQDELDIVLPISASLLWSSCLTSSKEVSLVGQLLASRIWCRGRIALLVRQYWTLQQKNAKSEQRDDLESPNLIDNCRDEVSQLRLPLNEVDVCVLSATGLRAAKRYDALRNKTLMYFNTWMAAMDAVVMVEDANRDKKEEFAADPNTENNAATAAVMEVDETSVAVAEEPVISLSLGFETDVDKTKKEESQPALLLLSPVNIARPVDPLLIEEAKMAMVQKFEKLTEDVDARQAATRWKLSRLERLRDAQAEMSSLLRVETEQWSSESALKEQYLRKQGLSPPPKVASTKNTTTEESEERQVGVYEEIEYSDEDDDSSTEAEEVSTTSSSSSSNMTQHVKQPPGGHSDLSLGRTDIEYVEARRSTTRILQAAGGDSNLSLAHGTMQVDTTTLSIRVQQSAGGDSNLSLADDQGGAVSEARSSTRVQQAAGGDSTLSLADVQDNDDAIARPSIRVQQSSGGDSLLSLAHHEDGGVALEAITPSTRVSQPAGGDSSLSLASDQVMEGNARLSTRVQQMPGGDSSLDLGHYEQASEAHETRSSTRVLQMAGGDSTFSLANDQGNKEVKGVVCSIRVHQQPGGDSSISLAHHQEGDEETARKRSSVRISQSPAAKSNLSLVDGSNEELGLPTTEERRSIRVQQSAGGDSNLSLADDQGGAVSEARSSTRVQQAAGGDSTLSLADVQDNDDVIARPSIRVQQAPGGKTSIVLGDGKKNKHTHLDLAEEQEEEEEGEGETDSAASMTDMAPSSDAFFTSCHKDMIYAEASKLLDDENTANMAFSSYYHALCMLGVTRGVLTVTSMAKNQKDHQEQRKMHQHEDEQDEGLSAFDRARCEKFLMQPLAISMKLSLAQAVQMQCQTLDQAALCSAIEESSLFAHLDSVDDIFLLSPRSDFLTMLSAFLVENHLDRFPSYSARVRQDYLVAKYKFAANQLQDISMLWSSSAIAAAVAKAAMSSRMKTRQFFHLATFDVVAQDEQDSSLVIEYSMAVSSNPADAVYSARGLSGLKISYDAPWPLCTLYTESMLANICKATQRLLELGQISAILRLVWGHIRSLKVRWQARKNEKVGKDHTQQQSLFFTGDKATVDGRMREVYDAFRVVQHAFTGIADFSSDRLRVSQLGFKDSLRCACKQGLGGVALAIKQYAHQLPISFFADFSSPSPLPLAIAQLLAACRYILKLLSTVSTDAIDSQDVFLVMQALSESVVELRRCTTVVVEKARVVSNSCERATSLLLYMNAL